MKRREFKPHNYLRTGDSDVNPEGSHGSTDDPAFTSISTDAIAAHGMGGLRRAEPVMSVK